MGKVWIVWAAMASWAGASTIYVSPNGAGTKDGKNWTNAMSDLSVAVSVVKPGDTILMQGGKYALAATVKITSSGTSASPIVLRAEDPYSKRADLDFSSQPVASTSQGIVLNGSWWKIEGLDVHHAGDNGMQISGGSNNVVEWCSFHDNSDAGFQIVHLAANNLVVNCDSYWNYDGPTSGGNADGFSPKLTLGTGNTFRGCRSWGNSDDGWDGYLKQTEAGQPDDITTTIEDSWAFNNGYYHGDPNSSKNSSAMNGNGFKMGGSANKDQRHNHILRRCLAFGNKAKQFDQNNNPGSMTLINCSAFGSGQNFAIGSEILATGKKVTVQNSVSLGGGSVKLVAGAVQSTNSWTTGFSAANADVQSTDTAGVRGPRKRDGSLPDVAFMHPAKGSKWIDAGTVVAGVAYNDAKPDLGAFESSGISASGRSRSFPEVAWFVDARGDASLFLSGREVGEVVIRLRDGSGRQIGVPRVVLVSPDSREIAVDLGRLPGTVSFCQIREAMGETRTVVLARP